MNLSLLLLGAALAGAGLIAKSRKALPGRTAEALVGAGALLLVVSLVLSGLSIARP